MADTKMTFDIDIDSDDDNFTELPDGTTEIDLDEDGKAAAKAKPAEDDDEIEIVDDTPEDEKNHFTPPGDVAGDEDTVSEDDMENYSENVRKRLKKLTFRQRSAERRASAAEREAAAALEVVKAQQAKLREYSTMIQNGEKQYITATTGALEAQIKDARTELAAAYESGDPMKIADAQDKLTAARVAASQAASYQPVAKRVAEEIDTLEKTPLPRAKTAPAEEVPDLEPNTKKWMGRNRWFSSPENPAQVRMRNYAIEFATGLEQDGYDPVADADEYYTAIDDEMRRRFPENFKAVSRRSTNTAGAGAGASNNAASQNRGKKKFVLTQSQARIAEKLGIPLKEYAKEYLRMYGDKS